MWLKAALVADAGSVKSVVCKMLQPSHQPEASFSKIFLLGLGESPPEFKPERRPDRRIRIYALRLFLLVLGALPISKIRLARE